MLVASNVVTVFRCEECEFEYDLDKALGAGRAIVRDAEELGGLLRTMPRDLGSTRELGMWSPLEYGCHVRDVLLVQRERVLVARSMDQPSFNPMFRVERVAFDGYAEQNARDVVRQLNDAALLFSNVLSRLGLSEWDRTLIYNYPEPMVRPLRWVAIHTLHEVRHHLGDVRNQLS
jgi:DinB superfamily